MFCHSLESDWNHGNAHFLRGIVTALREKGHDVLVLEPMDSWSRSRLIEFEGAGALRSFRRSFPHLSSQRYRPSQLDLDEVLEGAAIVLVHEWNEPALIARLGEHRACHEHYRLFFHDTHHAATDPHGGPPVDLSSYDGVLAFGRVLRDAYLERDPSRRAWTWHEAADVSTFRPRDDIERERDIVWIGNWGDGERTLELEEYLLVPAEALDLTGTIHGVRYPASARLRIARTGLGFSGWIPNHEVPESFARHRMTVHIPRRPYVRRLPGIPTIRVFEALACGIPLVVAGWEDVERLFTPGRDYLVARDREEMTGNLKRLLNEEELARDLAEHGRRTILDRHTCSHRVDELLRIYEEVA